MKENNHELTFPSGWFAVCFSKELKKGKILSVTFMGQEIVLFRTEEGVASALDAYCPHLGAHLGHGGKVVDGCIRCPFHHLKFDTNGQCSSAKHIKAKAWPLEERDGLIFLYHGNSDKMHKLPHFEKEGWRLKKTHMWKFKGSPQEIIENSIDCKHFASLHQWLGRGLYEVSFQDNFVMGNYSGKRKNPSCTSSFVMYALGSVVVKLVHHKLQFEMVSVAVPCPTTKDHVELRVLYFTKPLPAQSLFQKCLSVFVIPRMYKHINIGLQEDVDIWHHKKYLQHPVLQEDDLYIAQFRRWAQRFYS